MCEEGLGVLSGTTGDRTLWAHSTVAETLDVLFLHQRTNILLVEQLNLVILVRGAETVEEGLYNTNNVGNYAQIVIFFGETDCICKNLRIFVPKYFNLCWTESSLMATSPSNI